MGTIAGECRIPLVVVWVLRRLTIWRTRSGSSGTFLMRVLSRLSMPFPRGALVEMRVLFQEGIYVKRFHLTPPSSELPFDRSVAQLSSAVGSLHEFAGH